MEQFAGMLAVLMAATEDGPCTARHLARKAPTMPPYTGGQGYTPLSDAQIEQLIDLAVCEDWLAVHESEVGLPRYSIGAAGAQFILQFAQLGAMAR